MATNEFEQVGISRIEQADVSQLSDDAIAIGAAYGIESHIREFMRRRYPDRGYLTEEQIALREKAVQDDMEIRAAEEMGEYLDPERVVPAEESE